MKPSLIKYLSAICFFALVGCGGDGGDTGIKAPQSVQAQSNESSVTISWNNVANAESYDICVAAEPITVDFDNCNSLNEGRLLQNQASPTEITGLRTSGSREYYFVLVTNIGAEQSPKSAEVQSRVNSAPTAPSSIAGSNFKDSGGFWACSTSGGIAPITIADIAANAEDTNSDSLQYTITKFEIQENTSSSCSGGCALSSKSSCGDDGFNQIFTPSFEIAPIAIGKDSAGSDASILFLNSANELKGHAIDAFGNGNGKVTLSICDPYEACVSTEVTFLIENEG